jgi:hypothetical protein
MTRPSRLGPPEYLALAEQLLAEREVDTVVYVLNFLNDPFELERPNVERHAIWDGWAVRIETAPEPAAIVEFPARSWLMSRSHLVYAARRWWHQREAATWIASSDHGLPSEGDWDDLLSAAEASRAAEAARLAALEAVAEEKSKTAEQLASVRYHADYADEELAELDRTFATMRAPNERSVSYHERHILDSHPGDIINVAWGESSRSVRVTSEMYNQALASKRRLEAENAKRKRDYVERRERLQAKRDRLREQAKTDSDLDQLAELEQRLRELEMLEPPRIAVSPFEPHLRELAALCERHGASLLVVALPFDVQVSSQEWAKYGIEDGPDMRPTRSLLEDLVLDAEGLGIAAIDATYALTAAEPGAFLHGDIHMTPKGHAALAEVIATALRD